MMSDQTDYLTNAERKKLADFCGLLHNDGYTVDKKVGQRESIIHIDLWHPDSLLSQQWQIHAVLEAVKEEGLLNEYSRVLYVSIDPDGHKTESDTGNGVLTGIRLSTYTHPAQICRAVLSVIEEAEE